MLDHATQLGAEVTESHDTAHVAANSAFNLDPKIVDTLLDRLSTDDAFRERFSANPGAALESLGAVLGAEVALLKVSVLADKNDIAKARDRLRDALTGGLGNIPHRLEA